MATILVVDDLATNREFLVTLLRYKGHRLLEAANGREAIATVLREHPDLVITDVLMPVMDGYEFVRELRLDPAVSGIPVIFCTAHYGEREARALALASGVSGILIKPAEPEEVLRVVGAALSGTSATGERPAASPLPAEFDREHLRLVTDKLATSTDDLRTANSQLRALINIGLELASERDSNVLFERVCASARELFGATYITLGILDREKGTLSHLLTRGITVPDWIETGDQLTGMLATVVAERRPMRGQNPGGDPAALQLPGSHPPIQAFLAAPVASPSHVYGWICIVSNEGRTFTDDDQELLTALSGQVGRVYENGYFYAIASQRAVALEHEIVERKKAEWAVRQERDRAQLYLDTAEVILLALDVEGRVTLVNRHACEVLGWTADELRGRDFIETCIPARLRSDLRQKLASVQTGRGSDAQNLVINRSGKERLVAWRTTILRDVDGQVAGTLSSGTDVTDRHAAVDALQAAEERMRFALESAKVGIWDQNFRSGVLAWSETLEHHYGVPPGTFAGTFDAFVERVHPADRESVLETIGAAMKAGSEFAVKNRALWPDGTIRWLEGFGRVILDDQGEPLRAIGISLDVTERRNLEEQYHQAQKMEAIGRLAGGVAHDFNNMLTAILGYCELLLLDVPPSDPRREDIMEIQRAGMSAAGLTRQLLAFSRKQIIEPTLLDAGVVVREMRPMIARLIGEDVKFVLALPPGLAQITADRGQLEQIILNLAVNARDAMPNGGTLTIETGNVELDENYARTHLSVAPGHYIALTVTDTGVGMTPEVQARLFEPFFTTKPVGKGTGLGLATIHGIVSRAGGSVNVYSEVGRGSAFKVYFPRTAISGPADTIAAEAPHPDAARYTVLVVDDAEGVRELARRLLERMGHAVLIAATVGQAQELLSANDSVDVLLSDVVMPEASGPELARRLVAQRPALKVIYMSGYTEEAIVHHGVLKPGIAFLHKPFTADGLARKIRDVMGS